MSDLRSSSDNITGNRAYPSADRYKDILEIGVSSVTLLGVGHLSRGFGATRLYCQICRDVFMA